MPRRRKSDLTREEILKERHRLETINNVQHARYKAAYMARKQKEESVAAQIQAVKDEEAKLWESKIGDRIAKMRKAKQEHLALYGTLNLPESQCDHVDLD